MNERRATPYMRGNARFSCNLTVIGSRSPTMKVIHFTQGAADPIDDFEAQGVRYVPLAGAEGDVGATVVSCFHLSSGSRIAETPCFHDRRRRTTPSAGSGATR
jgi:hypothetical protein